MTESSATTSSRTPRRDRPADPSGPAGRSRRRARLQLLLRGTVGVICFLLVGEVLGRIGIIDRAYLPPSSEVLRTATHLVVNGEFLTDIADTLRAWATGLLIAAVIGVLGGLVLGSLPGVNSAVRVIVEFLRPIPAVALIPLAVLIIADRHALERDLAAYAAVWPILINTIYAIGEVDDVATDMARCFGLGRLSVVLRVSLPSIAPFAATGVRIGSAIALVTVISTEMISGGMNGIGIYIVKASQDINSSDLVFAAVLITGILGLLIDLLLRFGERGLFGWYFRRNEAQR